MLSPGERLGPYEVREPIGSGGMGVVYKAFDPALNRLVALKVLPAEFLRDSSFGERFQREIRIWASLEHPSIVPVYIAGIEDGQPFLSMKFVANGTLADRLKAGPLALDRAFSILADVAVALDFAHSRGIVHRDVKPANVLLDEHGRAYLSDFGIAHIVRDGPETQPHMGLVGTPRYMAPEQARGGMPDQRADVYSLGCMAYEMLTGTPPFTGGSPMDVIMRHLNEEPPAARTLSPSLPASAEAAILTAMSKDPARRWPAATLFVHALVGGGGAQGGQTISLPGLPAASSPGMPTAIASPRTGPSRRRRFLAVPLLGLAAGTGLFLAIHRYEDSLAAARAASLASGPPDPLIRGTLRALDAGAYAEAVAMADLAVRLYPENTGVRALRARAQRAWDAEKALNTWSAAPPSPSIP
jgi:serine/threonine-protein kinase